ncbi:glycosyltransferase [Bacteroidota bacterium]
MVETIFTGLFFTGLAVQLYFGVASLIRIHFHKPKTDMLHIEDRPVSIVVCAWNELSGLKRLLPQLYIQAYANYEIIVVDDRSSDGTYDFLINERENQSNLKIVKIDKTPDHLNNKKYAVTLGVKAASKELILLTDADCIPGSIHWIKSMTSHFDATTDFVLGYSQYEKKPGFLNLFIRYETLQTAILFFSSALGKDPYMGVGRNMAYRRKVFLEHKGFKGYYKVVGGDDDLFINKHAEGYNTKPALNSEGIVYSVPKTSIRSYFRQKVRHMSVGKYYRFRHRLKIGVFSLTKFITWLSFLWLMLVPGFSWYVLISWITLMSLITLQFQLSSKKLGDQFEIHFVPLLDLLYVLYLLGFGMVALIRKRIPWI